MACDKKTNVKCVNFDWVKQLEGLLETQQPPAKILLSVLFLLLFWRGIAESEQHWGGVTGSPPAPSAMIGSSISRKVMQTLFSTLSRLANFLEENITGLASACQINILS